jgi:myosin protein heavy chain
LEQTIKASEIPTLSILFVSFALNEADPTSVAGAGKAANFITVAEQYRDQLNELIDTLGSPIPISFVALSPTTSKSPSLLTMLSYSMRGNCVLEGIKISRMGYPNRLKYTTFLERYYLLAEHVPRC